MVVEVSSLLENVLEVLKRGVEQGGFTEELYTLLSKPERVVCISIPIRMDSGELRVFEGFRVQHCSALGPYKGGIRFHPKSSLEDTIALATIMTLKNSLAGIPYGGGKGAIRVDPSKLSKSELERLSRGYVRMLCNVLGEELDVPGPDVGTNPQVMAWMVDEYGKIAGKSAPRVFTGKPPALWGDPLRDYSTGYGCAVITKLIAEKVLGSLEDASIAVQGFGNVGSWHAYWVQKMGAKVVAVSDIDGTVYDPSGIDVELAMKCVRENGTVISYPRGQKINDPKAVLYLDVDIIAPDAVENQITIDNAGSVKAKLIVEGANGPTTPEAERVLYSRGKLVVPDLLANSGGVIGSYIEWVQGVTWYWWGESESRRKLEEIMRRSFETVYRRFEDMKCEKENVTMRDAAVVTSLDRLYQAIKVRGWL
ncbi:MAG: Glu/Leu/Phe/Val dehydrogenase [Thermofilaceae archaeon]